MCTSWAITEPRLIYRRNLDAIYKVIHFAGCISANTRPPLAVLGWLGHGDCMHNHARLGESGDMLPLEIIGASLTKPHTSVTALHMWVCIYACLFACLDRPLTVNFNERIQIFHEDRPEACKTSGGLLSECDIGDPKQRRLKLKHAWHWFVLLPMTVGQSQAD